MDITHSRLSFGQAVRRAIRAKTLVSYERDHLMGRTAVLANGEILNYEPKRLTRRQEAEMNIGSCDGPAADGDDWSGGFAENH